MIGRPLAIASGEERQPDRVACCALAYGDPLVELLVGDSLHPGGLATTRTLLAAAGLAPARRVLDAGCGLGASARLAATAFALRVDACDVSEAALVRARQLDTAEDANVHYAVGSITALPYPDAAFDAVLAECVLSTTDRRQALTEIRRVLKPDGRVLVSDMTARSLAKWPEPIASVLCLSGAWRPGELEETLGSAGFRIERTWDETPAVLVLLERIEARYRLLRSFSGGGALGGHVLELAARLGLEPSRFLASPSSAFENAREAIRGGGIGYVAAIARVTADP